MKRLIIFLVVISVVAISVIMVFFKVKYSSFNPKTATPTSGSTHKVKFFEERIFLTGAHKAEDISGPDYLIRGGIVPHHLFAGEIISDFFKRLSFQKISTIILIGPNHYEKGDFKVLGSSYNWETPHGVVNPDKMLIEKLTDDNLMRIDETILPEDHAVSGLIPYVKYYLPEAKIVPILIKGDFSEKESEVLASSLKNLIHERVVVVAAVDFSHYLNSFEAKEKDRTTEKVMREFDYRNLYALNNDYLDSPPSIGILLKLMQKLNSTNSELLFNTNSGEMQKNNTIETTSYFSVLYYRSS